MQILPVIGAVLVAALVLSFLTVRKMNPEWFRVRTSVGRVFTFDVEISSAGTLEKQEMKAISPVRRDAA